MRLIRYMTSVQGNDVILDFFSGSATTAHAVMQLNAEDGGNRRFIMVQLPEVCGEKSEEKRIPEYLLNWQRAYPPGKSWPWQEKT